MPGSDDIRSFFDDIDQEWMLRFLEHQIADKRVIRLIRKWLTARTIEDGRRVASVQGTRQGSEISPLLLNIYLHYARHIWAHQWLSDMLLAISSSYVMQMTV